jgi:hypothetical protein
MIFKLTLILAVVSITTVLVWSGAFRYPAEPNSLACPAVLQAQCFVPR